MTPRAALFGLGLSLLMNTAGGARVQDLPGATDTYGGFGIPDQGGSRLLVIPKLARPQLLKTALCAGGRRVPVRFAHRQAEDANSDGRQTSRSFDKLAGNVFAVSGKTVDPGTPCFLASDALLAGSAVLSVGAPDGSGACLQPGRFAALRDRPVVHCWPLARLGPGKDIALLEFERRGKDALASLVLVDGSGTIFADVHAEFRGAGEDLWRVDDGGVLSPEGLQVVCVLERKGWHALGTAWVAAEGRSLSLWIAEGGDQFTKVVNDYWYQAPR